MIERDKNTHINESLILRDGELFNRKNGIGFFSPTIFRRYLERGLVKTSEEPRIIWLPGETKELFELLTLGDSLLIEGALGQGKSALIYGLRSMCRENNIPYCYIDGHYTSTPPEKIVSALKWADNNNAIVFWDSFDYLLAGAKKRRKLPVGKHQARSSQILGFVKNITITDQIQLVISSHDENWLRKYGNPKLLKGDWESITDKLRKHKVKGSFQNENEVSQFLFYAGFSKELIDIIIYLAKNFIPELWEYRILKILALGKDEETARVRNLLISGGSDINNLIEAIKNFINQINQKTKKLNGDE